MHAQHLVLPAGVGNGVELWLVEDEACSARPICPVSMPSIAAQGINALGENSQAFALETHLLPGLRAQNQTIV
jgi:hypothetical protein